MRFLTFFLGIFLAASGPVRGQGLSLPPLKEPNLLMRYNDTLRVTVIGDVMMHERQLRHDMGPFLHYLKPLLSRADLALANMEFSLGGAPYTGYPAFSAPDDYPDYVAGCGVNVFLLANNHLLDRGRKGLVRTLEQYALRRDKAAYTGASRDSAEDRAVNPLIIRRGGLKLAFINAAYGSNNPSGQEALRRLDDRGLEELFARARAEKPDFIIALPHWGTEYTLRHNATQERTARRMVELGADVIVGAHPHVVQDTSHIRGVPVIYSVGNAVSNMSAPNTRLELAVTLRFVCNTFTGSREMLEPELHFLWCTLPGKLTPSYATVPVQEWADRRSDWLDPSDYDNMMATLRRVKTLTGIEP